MLFEENEISFEDKNLFNQNYKKWKNAEILSNELEVIGFYFSDHPLNHYPKKFFELEIRFFNVNITIGFRSRIETQMSF